MSDSAAHTDWSTWAGFVERLYRQSEFSIKLGLAAIGEALELEGHPERSHDRVLVGGTNGKGETSAFLAAILQAHGLEVGLYTSPHILDLRERFRVDGRPLSRDAIHRIGRRLLEAYAEPDGDAPQLTFFELTTLMGVLAFAEQDVDVVVYEVGLGGRLDATNALEPDMSVVTSIALDHQQYLGDTLRDVAREKAGIFRPGRPAVIGRQLSIEALQALEEDAPRHTAVYGRDYRVADDASVEFGAGTLEAPWLTSMPRTRRWNAACALQAAYEYLGEEFSLATAARGLQASRWPGRLDLRELANPRSGVHQPIFFDAAHNPAAAQLLFEHLAAHDIRVGAALCSAMSDKDLAGIFEWVPDHMPVYAATLESTRAASADQLREALAGKSLRDVGPTEPMLQAAMDEVAVGEGKAVLVFGSIYLLGECFEALGIDASSLCTYQG